MSIYSQEKIFYVYQYLRSNKSKYGEIGSPYYIGKGKENRAYDTHHTFYPPKDKLRIQILSKNMNEADAFQLEMLLIHLYGRIDLDSGCLRNKTDGGDGTSGRVVSTEEIQMRVIKNLATRHKNGTLNCTTSESLARGIDTRRKNGNLKRSKECIQKRINTRRKNQNIGHTPESIVKMIASRIANGTLNTGNPISRMRAKETWAKKIASGYKRTHNPESLAQAAITRRATWARKKAEVETD